MSEVNFPSIWTHLKSTLVPSMFNSVFRPLVPWNTAFRSILGYSKGYGRIIIHLLMAINHTNRKTKSCISCRSWLNARKIVRITWSSKVAFRASGQSFQKKTVEPRKGNYHQIVQVWKGTGLLSICTYTHHSTQSNVMAAFVFPFLPPKIK